MAYLYTNSTTGSNLATGLSTQIIVEVNNTPVGAIQSISATQNRSLGEITEVGTDGIIEIVPNGPTRTSLRVTRIVFDGRRLTVALGRAFHNIQSQRFPFDIKIFDNSNAVASNAEGDPSASGQVVYIYKNCWFESTDVTYASRDYIITENASIKCEYVRTFTGDNQSAVPFGPNVQEVLEFGTNANIERAADVGRRGSLDAAGLAKLVG
jgi:hypothetical protein